jgi:hypothetical protein
VFSLVVCCGACLVLERAYVFRFVGCVLSCCVLCCVSCSRSRICVSVGGLCSLLLCVVLRVLFSNAIRVSRVVIKQWLYSSVITSQCLLVF